MNQGKYVFSQIMDTVYWYEFDQCVKRYRGNYRARNLSCYDQFLALVFGQLSHKESLRGIVVSLQSQKKKLYHLGFSNELFLSTLAGANKQRNWKIYRDFAQVLIEKARKLYFDDHEFDLDLEGACYVIDASVIELCLTVFPWAKLRTIRAGVKLNLQMDLKGNIPTFFKISNAKEHDVNFLDNIDFETGAYYIVDRGYLDYKRLFKIHQAEAFFVIRAKKKLSFRRLYSNKVDKKVGLRCDQVIKFAGIKSQQRYPEKLRRIKYYDQETERYYVFLTNDFNIKAKMVADLYKNRWQIELFFKWIKQHLRIKAFWGYSENAVKTQICIAICAYLIVAIIKRQLKIERNLYEILQILNSTLLTKDPLFKLLSKTDLNNLNDQSSKQPQLWD